MKVVSATAIGKLTEAHRNGDDISELRSKHMYNGENTAHCPFCGGDMEIYCEENMFKPRCKNTHTCGCQIALWFDEPEDAVKAWNERWYNEER